MTLIVKADTQEYKEVLMFSIPCTLILRYYQSIYLFRSLINTKLKAKKAIIMTMAMTLAIGRT